MRHPRIASITQALTMSPFLLRLPIPPSVNEMYYNRKGGKGRGRIKTAKYRKWIAEADKWYLEQKKNIQRVTGPYELSIKLPKIRGDLSNRIKIAEDYLVSREITSDDRYNRKISIEIDETLQCCEISIIPRNGS